MTDGLDNWVVLYRPIGCLPADPPEAFSCKAEDGDHADEQCRNAYAGCDVVWSFLGDVDGAYAEYFDAQQTDDDGN